MGERSAVADPVTMTNTRSTRDRTRLVREMVDRLGRDGPGTPSSGDRRRNRRRERVDMRASKRPTFTYGHGDNAKRYSSDPDRRDRRLADLEYGDAPLTIDVLGGRYPLDVLARQRREGDER